MASSIDHSLAALDHSRFPDADVIRVRHRSFFISRSYLALRSSYFHDCFTDPQQRGFRFDFDPEVFADLLAMVYPSHKPVQDCAFTPSLFADRFHLCLYVKFRCLIIRMMEYSWGKSELVEIVVHGLRNYNEADNYKMHMSMEQLLTPRHVIVHTFAPRDVERITDYSSLPDGVRVSFTDISLSNNDNKWRFVSASELSLFSESLYEMFYNLALDKTHPVYGTLTRSKIPLPITCPAFDNVLKALRGSYPENASSELLNSLSVLGIDSVEARYRIHLEEEIFRHTFDEFDRVLPNYVALMDYYGAEGRLNMLTFDDVTCALSLLEVELILSNTNNIVNEGTLAAFRHRAGCRQLISIDIVIAFEGDEPDVTKVQCTDSCTLFYLVHFASKVTGVAVDQLAIYNSEKWRLDLHRSLRSYGFTDGQSIIIEKTVQSTDDERCASNCPCQPKDDEDASDLSSEYPLID